MASCGGRVDDVGGKDSGDGEEEKEGGGDGGQEWFHGVVLRWELEAQR